MKQLFIYLTLTFILSIYISLGRATQGIFQMHATNWAFASEFPFERCCPFYGDGNGNGNEDGDDGYEDDEDDGDDDDIFVQNSTLTCSLSHCRVIMRACLTLSLSENIAELKCIIGKGEIVAPLTGLPDENQGSYKIVVQERWKTEVGILMKIYHQEGRKNNDNSKNEAARNEILLYENAIFHSKLFPTKDWTTTKIANKMFNVTLLYRFQCDQHFYGDQCDQKCSPRNDSHGHYYCGPRGQRVCLFGWEGEYCDKAICLESNCKNGICVGPNNCRCHRGWQGKFCDECIKYPGCVNGSCKKRKILRNNLTLSTEVALTCICDEGWAGMFCNVDQFYCQHHANICENGGTCVNANNPDGLQYTCLCPLAFSGTHCERAQSSCHTLGCQNGGLCENGKLNCTCPFGFYGDQCEYAKTVDCRQNPCKGQKSKCVNKSTNSSPNHRPYLCICEPERYGENCDKIYRPCDSQPCINGGKCVDNAEGYRCVCPVGLGGNHCQVDLNDCHRLSCGHGTRCVDRINSVACECINCDGNDAYDDPCLTPAHSSVCLNGGTCHSRYSILNITRRSGGGGGGSGGGDHFICQCPPNFNGTRCEYKMTPIRTESIILLITFFIVLLTLFLLTFAICWYFCFVKNSPNTNNCIPHPLPMVGQCRPQSFSINKEKRGDNSLADITDVDDAYSMLAFDVKTNDDQRQYENLHPQKDDIYEPLPVKKA